MKRICERVRSFFLSFIIGVIEVWKDFSGDNGSQAAAAFAFFSFLSILSLIILAGSVLGIVLSGNQKLLQSILDHISSNAPGISRTVQDALEASVNHKGTLGLVGALGLLYTGTKVFDSFQVWLNSIWEVEKPRYLRKKSKSLLAMLVIGVVVTLGFGMHIALFAAHEHLDFIGPLLPILVFLVTAFVLFVGLMFIYSYSIETRLGWCKVWVGALIAAVLINPVQMALSWFYTKMSDLPTVFGSFAGMVLTIVVIYYIGYIIYLGAESNRYLDSENIRGPKAVNRSSRIE